MPRHCSARARGCGDGAAMRWRCSSAVLPARWPRSATRDCAWRRDWPRGSSCRFRRRPGIPIATASRKRPGPWHAEWPTLPTLLLVTSGALAAVVEIAEGLEIDAARMLANLGATGGLIMAEAVTMALAGKIGKCAAHHLVETASKQAAAGSRSLREVLTGDPGVTAHLDAATIAGLFE